MFPAKGEGSLRAACWHLDGEDTEKAEPGLPGMPTGCGSSVCFFQYTLTFQFTLFFQITACHFHPLYI